MDLMNVLGYTLAVNNSVIRSSDFFCVVESVEHLIAQFTSPATMTRGCPMV